MAGRTKQPPRDEVRCTAVAKSGDRCQTARMPDRDVCYRHSLSEEQALDLAKKAGRTSARVRSMPPSLRRRRRTAKERIADPSAPAYVPMTEDPEALPETVRPQWLLDVLNETPAERTAGRAAFHAMHASRHRDAEDCPVCGPTHPSDRGEPSTAPTEPAEPADGDAAA